MSETATTFDDEGEPRFKVGDEAVITGLAEWMQNDVRFGIGTYVTVQEERDADMEYWCETDNNQYTYVPEKYLTAVDPIETFLDYWLETAAVEFDREIVAQTHDPVNHPQHYTSHPSGIETIELTRHMNFNMGNALKYIMRADHKGNAIQDIEKAIWYLTDELKRRRESA